MNKISNITTGLLAIFLCAGCATQYKLSAQQESLVKGLSETRAQAILQSIVRETPEYGGLCATNANWVRSHPRVTGFDGSKVRFIDYTAYVKSVNSKVANFGGATSVSVNTRYGLDPSSFYFDFKNASKVRIVAQWVMMPGGPCMRHKTNRALGIADKNGFFINLDVPTDKLDDVLLAIIRLAPEATVIEGSGL